MSMRYQNAIFLSRYWGGVGGRREDLLLYLINAGSIARATSRVSACMQRINWQHWERTGLVVARHGDGVDAGRDIGLGG